MPVKPLGVILAGGRSSRMGEVRKPLVSINGQPMLSQVIARLGPQVQQLLLSCEPGDESLSVFECPLIEDAFDSHRGPLAGLYSALLYAARWHPGDDLMLCPCDAPFIPVTLVKSLHASVSGTPGSVAVVSYEGVVQPTFSLWNVQHLPKVEAALLGRQQAGLKHVLHDLPHVVLEWPVSEPPPFYNINTPEQLDIANRWLQQEKQRASKS